MGEELRGRELKRKVFELLWAEDFARPLEVLCTLPPRQVINPLFSCLCSLETEIKWRAVTAMGAVVANLAEKDMESARVVMRRMIWNLNDESGGIGWGIPEAMGEIMARHGGLAREYANILVSYVREDGNFLEHQLLQRGVLWGLARLAQFRPELVQDAADSIRRHLTAKEAVLRGLAVWIMGLLGDGDDSLETLVDDETEITLYQNGIERVLKVSEMAKEAIAGRSA